MSYTLPELQLPQRDELRAASVKFLGNVKVRLGEHSFQLFDVHKTLDLFGQGTLSKKETHKTILDTLEGHEDLRQELMDILMHPASRWAPDDFDLPTQHSAQPPLNTAPQFLQPAHEPQMRLPFFSSWFSIPQNDQSANPSMFSGYGGFNSQQSLTSSPSVPAPPPFQQPNPTAYLWKNEDPEVMYAGLHDDGILPLPVQTAFRNPWQEGSIYTDVWTNDDIGFLSDIANVSEQFELREAPALPFNDHLPAPLTYPQYAEPYTTPTSLLQETPHSVRTPQLTYDSLPSPVEQDLFYTARLEEQQLADLHVPPGPSSRSPPSTSRTGNTTEETSTKGRYQSLEDVFIHILCSKGFATLSGVKKHHWGKKVNDLATTTGCWAKHKKPSVAWDDHPSCKEGRSTSVMMKSMPPLSKQRQNKASISQSKSPSSFGVPQLQPVPGFPTLEHLPHTVAKTVNAGSATSSGAQEADRGHHTHLLPPRFDSLLTVVNVVSQIDAPKPRGRTKSIALHLDAQVVAAEQHHPFIPYEPSTSSLTRLHYRPIAPAALNTTGSNDVGHFPHEMTDLSVNYVSEEQPSVLPSDVEESYVATAFSQPFQLPLASSSGPTRKKRKV